MAGVIDANGVQWEHCTSCGRSVRLTNLGYEKPSKEFKHGRDLCLSCVNKLPDLSRIVPAQEWRAVRG